MAELEHVLTISSEVSMSHAGSDYIGRCSCRGWVTSGGGCAADWNHLIREEHRQHVAEVTRGK